MQNLSHSSLVKFNVSFGATVIAWLPQIDYSLRIIASVIAIVAGLPVAWKVIKGLWSSKK